MKNCIVVTVWLMMMAFTLGAGIAQAQERSDASQSARVRVLASDGVKEVMNELLPKCERAIGRPIDIQFNTSAVLKQRIDDGEAFDVAILTAGLIDDLIKKGKIAADTRSSAGRALIGVGVRSGTSKPDISTAEALKRVLLSAKSITYNQNGASRAVMEKIYNRLGIAAMDIEPKIMLQTVPGGPQESVAQGKAELVIALVSEILPVQGLDLLGTVPVELGPYIPFAGGVRTDSQNADASKALLKFISGPEAAPTFKAKGMDFADQ